VAAEGRLLEKPRHELVTLDLVDVLLTQGASALDAEASAARTGNSFGGRPVGVAVGGVDGVSAVAPVSHVYRQRYYDDACTMLVGHDRHYSPAAEAALAAASATVGRGASVSSDSALCRAVETSRLELGKLRRGRRRIYLPRTITILNKKNTILMLARSRLPEKQKPSMLAANIVNTLTLIQKNQ